MYIELIEANNLQRILLGDENMNIGPDLIGQAAEWLLCRRDLNNRNRCMRRLLLSIYSVADSPYFTNRIKINTFLYE